MATTPYSGNGKGFLTDAFGKHVVKGILAQKKVVYVGSEKQVSIEVLMGRGEWDAIEELSYAGEVIDPSNYTFHPGIPHPAVDTRFPNGLRHAGIARYTVTLPVGMASEGDPDQMKAIVRTAKVPIYSALGVQTGFAYSVNPADHFVEVVRRNCARLGLVFFDHINWAKYGDARAYYGTSHVQANYTLAPSNFHAEKALTGSLAVGDWVVSVQAVGTVPGTDFSLRAGDNIVTLDASNQTITAACDAVAGAVNYRFWFKSPSSVYTYRDSATPSVTHSTTGTAATPPTGAGGIFTLTRPLFESQVFFSQPTSMQAALNAICWQCASNWQRVGKQYTIITPQARTPVHHLDVSNTMPGSFRFWRTSRTSRANRVTAVDWRDATSATLAPGFELVVNREATQAKVGINNEEVGFFTLSPNQVYRLINWRIRNSHDLNEQSAVTEDGSGAHILPGDVITISDNHANWSNKQFEVIEREAGDSDSAGNLSLGLKEYDSASYSDNDSAPLQSTQPTDIPSRFLAPSAVLGVSLTQTTETKNDGTVSLGISGVIQFAENSGVRGIVYHKKPGGSYEYLAETTPNASGYGGFRLQGATTGVNTFEVVEVSLLGVTQTAPIIEYPITILAKATAPTLPSSLTAVYDGSQLQWSWAASPDTDIRGYNIYDGSNSLLQYVDSTNWSELVLNAFVVTRKLKAVNTSNVVSSAFLSATYTAPLPPAPPRGALRRTGLALRWVWDAPAVATANSQTVDHYEVKDESGLVVYSTPGLHFEESPVPGKLLYTRTVTAIDYLGQACAAPLSMTTTLTDVPAIPSNYILAMVGRTFRHSWNTHPVIWTVYANSTLQADNGVRRIGGLSGFTTGARSNEGITGDGFIEVPLTTNNVTNKIAVGLTQQTGTLSTLNKADYAVSPRTTAEGGGFGTYKSGVLQATLTTPTWAAGDKVRMTIENGAVKCYLNGTLFYTFSQVLTYPLTSVFNGVCLISGGSGIVSGFRIQSSQTPVEFEASRTGDFSDIVFSAWGGDSVEAVPQGSTPLANRTTVVRYLRAINAAGNASASFSTTGIFSAPLAPVVTKDTATSTDPGTLRLHVAPDAAIARESILFTLVQVRSSVGSYPADTLVGTSGNIRFVGMPEEVSLAYAPGGAAVVRIAYEDMFTENLLDHQWSTPVSHTFPQVADVHIANLKAGKIQANTGDFQIIFADIIGSSNFIGDGTDTAVCAEDPEYLLGTGGSFNPDTRVFTKTAADGFNAGFKLSRALAFGDGQLDFTIPYSSSTSTEYAAFGLSKMRDAAPASLNDFKYAIVVASSVFAGTPTLYLQESGATVATISVSFSIGDVLSIRVLSGVVTFYRNNGLLYTSATAPNYPLAPQVILYKNGESMSESILKPAGFMQDIQPLKPHWRNMVGITLDSNDALARTVSGTGWGTSGAFSTESIIGSGFVEFVHPGNVAGACFSVGLSATDADQDYATQRFCVMVGSAAALGAGVQGLYVFQNGTYAFGLFDGTLGTGDVIRISLENGAVNYRRNGVLMYTSGSTTLSTDRWYVDTAIWGTGAAISSLRMMDVGSRSRGWRATPDGIGQFGKGVKLAGSTIDAVRARSIGAINETNRYRGNDFGTPLETRLSASMFSLGTLRTFEEDIYTELIVRLPESITNDPYANFDSVKLARVKVYNLFGEVITECEQSSSGSGKLIVGMHDRSYADPIEQAVFSIEFRNAYGWSRPVYWTNAIGGATSDAWGAAGWNWSGNGTSNTPPWRVKTDFPMSSSAVPVSESVVNVTWKKPVTNTTGGTSWAVYARVYQKGKNRNAWVPLVYTSSTTENYTATGLSPNTEYEFLAHGGGAYNWANYAYVKTLPPQPAALPVRESPSGLSARVLSTTAIDSNWTRNATTNTGVNIYRDGALLAALGAAVTTYSDTGRTANTVYRYKVVNTWGAAPVESSFSNEVEAKTLAVAAPTANDPSALVASVTGLGDSVALAWNRNSGDLTQVQRSTDGGATYSTIATRTTGVSTYTDSLIGYTTHLYYRVRNTSGSTSGFSNVADIWTNSDTKPDPQCVTPDTLVLMADGTWKQIGEIQIGDKLQSVSLAGTGVIATVLNVANGFSTELRVIHADNGAILKGTSTHPIIRHVGDATGLPSRLLQAGDSVLSFGLALGGRTAKITEIEALTFQEPIPVVTLSIDEDHVFITPGMVSHNISYKS